jgi:hypothetical protein|tara:strand:- start:916 stop:1131 length:216 start_codon:yes stop_codon:yes gene_type:complete
MSKPKRKKCHTCGKMVTNPYVYHIVPARNPWNIPNYVKNAPRTDRVDLKGNLKVAIYNYCNKECEENDYRK